MGKNYGLSAALVAAVFFAPLAFAHGGGGGGGGHGGGFHPGFVMGHHPGYIGAMGQLGNFHFHPMMGVGVYNHPMMGGPGLYNHPALTGHGAFNPAMLNFHGFGGGMPAQGFNHPGMMGGFGHVPQGQLGQQPWGVHPFAPTQAPQMCRPLPPTFTGGAVIHHLPGIHHMGTQPAGAASPNRQFQLGAGAIQHHPSQLGAGVIQHRQLQQRQSQGPGGQVIINVAPAAPASGPFQGKLGAFIAGDMVGRMQGGFAGGSGLFHLPSLGASIPNFGANLQKLESSMKGLSGGFHLPSFGKGAFLLPSGKGLGGLGGLGGGGMGSGLLGSMPSLGSGLSGLAGTPFQPMMGGMMPGMRGPSGVTPPGPGIKNPASEKNDEEVLLDKLYSTLGYVAVVSAEVDDKGKVKEPKSEHPLCSVYEEKGAYNMCDSELSKANRFLFCVNDEGKLSRLQCGKDEACQGSYNWQPVKGFSGEVPAANRKAALKAIEEYAEKHDLKDETFQVRLSMPASVSPDMPCSELKDKNDSSKLRECYDKGIITAGGLGPPVRPGERLRCTLPDGKSFQSLVCRKVEKEFRWSVIQP